MSQLKDRTPQVSDEQPEVSRRGFMRSAIGSAALVSALTVSGTAQAHWGWWGWGGPVWKSTAWYRNYPNGRQMCANCRYFRPLAGCAIVESPISPHGWSRYWAPRGPGGYGGGMGGRY